MVSDVVDTLAVVTDGAALVADVLVTPVAATTGIVDPAGEVPPGTGKPVAADSPAAEFTRTRSAAVVADIDVDSPTVRGPVAASEGRVLTPSVVVTPADPPSVDPLPGRSATCCSCPSLADSPTPRASDVPDPLRSLSRSGGDLALSNPPKTQRRHRPRPGPAEQRQVQARSSTSVNRAGAVMWGLWLASISSNRQPGSSRARSANCRNTSPGPLRWQYT